MNVYWLEQTGSDVPECADWLSASEETCLDSLRIPKRRADWRLGRWTAKRAVAAYLNAPENPRTLANIEIRPASTGAPEVYFGGKPADVSVSISHRSGIAVCAVTSADVALGCDLEVIESRSAAFLADYFTTEEQESVARADTADRPRLVCLLWSAKESALKALRTGLRADTRSVAVHLKAALLEKGRSGQDHFEDSTSGCVQCAADAWQALQVRSADGQMFQGWWQRTGGLLRTLVSTPPPAPPIPLVAGQFKL